MVPAARATPPPQTPSPSSLGDQVFRRNAVSATSAKGFSGSKKGAAKGPMKAVGTSRRRPLRKDRHSKIFTARGPRDRRMRLSLDVARKFFDLQDMLGFDKASKTVDWLLTNATSSIKELASCSSPALHAPGKSESSTSECEVISTNAPRSTALPPAKGLKKGATQSAHSRESRVLARARARERTREKMGQKGVDYLGQRKLQVEEKLDGGCSGSSMELMGEEAVISNTTGPIPVFDYNGNLVSEAIGFDQEHWSLQSSGSAEEQRVLLPDAQLMPWFWDPFSNPSI